LWRPQSILRGIVAESRNIRRISRDTD
jgi:hypothetical protein